MVGKGSEGTESPDQTIWLRDVTALKSRFLAIHWATNSHSASLLSDALIVPLLILIKRSHDIGTLTQNKAALPNFKYKDAVSKGNILANLRTACDILEDEFRGFGWVSIFDDQVQNNRLSEAEVTKLAQTVGEIELGDSESEHFVSPLFARAFNAYIDEVLSSLRQPTTYSLYLSSLLSSLCGSGDLQSVYGPCGGSGSLLANIAIRNDDKNAYEFTIQDVNERALLFAKFRMLASGVKNISFYNSDIFSEPITIDRHLKQFDRVVADVFGVPNSPSLSNLNTDTLDRFPHGIPAKSRADFAFVQHALASTKPDGQTILLVAPRTLFGHSTDAEIRKSIIEDDLLEAVIGMPAGSIIGTNVAPIILIFNKQKPEEKREKVFFTDLQRHFSGKRDYHPAHSLSASMRIRHFRDDPPRSRVVDIGEIRENGYNLTVNLYVDDSEEANLIRELTNQTVGYEIFSLGDESVTNKITKIRNENDILDDVNAIYIPNIATMKPVCNLKNYLENKKTKPDRYYRVELNSKLVFAEFAEYFFETELGKLWFGKCGSGATIPHVNLSALSDCRIAIPHISVQHEVLKAVKSINDLTKLLQDYKTEVAIKPRSARSLSNKLDDMRSSVMQLSDEEKILSLLKNDESKTLEFKQTFSLNIHSKQKDKDVEGSSLKTIGAFLNMEGGDLLIGVADNKEVVGVNEELEKFFKNNKDNFMLNFKNRLEHSIGAQHYPYIDQRLVEVNSKHILWINCVAAPNEVWVDGNNFFVRTTPATDRLEGPALSEYLRSNFPR